MTAASSCVRTRSVVPPLACLLSLLISERCSWHPKIENFPSYYSPAACRHCRNAADSLPSKLEGIVTNDDISIDACSPSKPRCPFVLFRSLCAAVLLALSVVRRVHVMVVEDFGVHHDLPGVHGQICVVERPIKLLFRLWLVSRVVVW